MTTWEWGIASIICLRVTPPPLPPPLPAPPPIHMDWYSTRSCVLCHVKLSYICASDMNQMNSGRNEGESDLLNLLRVERVRHDSKC